MKLFVFLAYVALAASAPTSNENTAATHSQTLTINDEFYTKEFKIYTADHDIVKIMYPINALNIGDDDDDDDDETQDRVIFIVEAENGEYKGITVLRNVNETKILPTGTSFASANDETKNAYFGATDGLYKYYGENNTVEKYMAITDSIIDLVKVNGSDAIYILTDKNEVFKVTDDGAKKKKIDVIVGAKQIVLDDSNNLYYLDQDQKLYVYTEAGVKEFEGLPKAKEIMLLKPAFAFKDSVLFILDGQGYFANVDGTFQGTQIFFETMPSAVSIEATLMLYVARGKELYEYNVLLIMIGVELGNSLSDVQAFLNEKSDEIQSLSTRSRSDLKA